ncbi:CCA tRNA nucleotidyltransferase [Sphingomicrobium marinum]|uniref:CCA tRNA nucleotidyltransferase n=1 Tax=Sphingomicrobium marinum TaxID=1227950 RepID=UPI0022405BD1|nr:CCA tRNA nucleotidyltransferase [Sphingomicrobium marinum]
MKFDFTRYAALPGIPALLDALGAGDGQVRYVGGIVRDTLLGETASDIDMATVHDPQEVVRRLEAAGIKAVPTGIDHGTVTAVSDHTVVEVTTLRADVETDGRRATVAYTDDWKEDAARRDFTINALYADPLTGAVSDYFGGLGDLDGGIVRFIGDPLERIAEDHLRILRFFRFHARFGEGAPDAAGLAACAQRANDLMALSRERIADEILKLLGLADPTPTVRTMNEAGIFAPVLPEISAQGVEGLAALTSFEREHNLDTSPIRRLAALLPSEPDAGRDVASRLKLSNDDKSRLVAALTCGDMPPRELAYRLGRTKAEDRLALMQDASGIAALRDFTIPTLPIKGGELIERGVEKGPDVARTLRAIEDAWIDAGFPTGKTFEEIVAEKLA